MSPTADRAEVNPYWFIVFCDPMQNVTGPGLAYRRNRFLKSLLVRCLRPGFRHCFAVRPAHHFDGWIIMNPHSACMDVLELSWEAGLNFLTEQIRKGDARIVCVRTRRPRAWVPRWVMTCVTSVAHLIGTPSKPWMTPYDLYCQLQQEDSDMGGIFSAPKPDTSAADAQAAEAKKEADDMKKKNQARINAMRGGSMGRSLLTYDKTGEQGVKTTLGAG